MMILNNCFMIMMVNIVMVLLCCPRAYSSEVDVRIESSARQTYVIKTFLKDDDVSIQSKDGNVILSGTVSKESSRLLAREAVAAVPGVISVTNNLKVSGVMPSELSDAWIVTQIKTTLLFHRNVNSVETSVVSDNGVVTLRGVATSLAQKDLSTEYAKDIEGVKRVVNEMVVSGTAAKLGEKTIGDAFGAVSDSVDDASITAMVKTTLLYHRSTSILSTTVQTNNGVVSLGGKARNAAEKALATKLVSDVRGVKNVVNNMIIEKDESKTNSWESTGGSIDRSALTSTSPENISSGPVGKKLRSDPRSPEEGVRLRVLSVMLITLSGR